MAAGSDHHDAIDTKHPVQPVASPRSELVNNFIAYYSSADCASVPAEAFSSHDLLSAAPLSSSSTPTSSSSSSTAASIANMRPAKKLPVQSSGQSTDSEQMGNGSSESSSSLGDSAAAAARVLAAWQDRPAVSATADTTVSAGISPASLADSSAIWTAARASAARVQSSTSTPRQVASSFGPHTREGSAPVTGSLEASNRRPDMGFLALLNSAAAYVAESSIPTQHQQHNQHHAADHPYLTHGDMLSDGTLTLSGINNGFGQANVDASAEQGDYSAHYSATLSSAAYQDLAQALQHIAATSSSTGEGIISTAAMESRGHGSYVAHEYVSTDSHVDTRSASAIRPDQIMAGDSLVAMKPDFSTIPRQSTASASKRKRKEAPESVPTPTKRKASHASEYPRGAASPIPPHSAEARRAARKWSEEETDNLLQGCTKYGVGAWKKILDDSAFTFNNRTSVDLKDRFRTIRAQECAHSPHSKLTASGKKNHSGKEPDVVWPLPPNSQRLQGLQRVQRKPTRNYTGDEDRRLLIGVLRHANHWTKIAADPDLKLGDRPGQSLRDRLRNAFPEVFELFGYVIPKKERADREPCGAPQEPERTFADPRRRKAPTASKRMDGTIPENIKDKIMAVLSDMNASLDPHPIAEPEDEGVDSCYDADADGDPSAMDVDSASPGASRTDKGGSRAGTTTRAGSKTGRGPRRRSTVSGELAGGTAPLPADLSTAANGEAGGGGKRAAASKRSRSRSKTMASIDTHQPTTGLSATSGGSLVGFKLDSAVSTTAFPLPMSNDGGIHSAPTHTDNPGCGPMGDLGAFSDCDHRRTGTLSAGAFGNSGHRNFLLDSFAPSVFTRPMGTMTPTDQLDALALEGRFGSGYSTPTHSAKRRHSVQVDINDAMVAAVAAGMDRSSFSSSLHYFHPSVTGLDHHHHHSTGASGNASLQMSAADTIRRMTVGGPIDADAFLFPRIPEDDATAAAAAAVAGISAQMSTSQTVSSTPASDSMHIPGGASSTATATNIGATGIPTGDMYKFPGSTTADSSALSATVDTRGDMSAGYRGQLRSAQRLLRANGVADDNSIGLSTTSSGESRVDLEALAQFSQWFPQFAPASLGWGMGDNGGQMGESIDPNMLDAGLDSAMAAVANSGTHGAESNMTHARRRSQYDWYGLTPSLAAALEAASTSAAVAVAAQAAAASDDTAMSTLGSFGLGQGSLNPSYRRPSMPIFPTFGYTPGDMLGMSGNADTMAGNAEQGLYGVATSQQDSAGMVATAAADAVAVALGERNGGGPVRTRADVPGRRRTMHVPPLLLEGVATAEFGNPGAADAYVAQSLGVGAPQGRHGSAPYLPRPTGQTAAATAAMTRGRRSRTISSNSNTQAAAARLGAAGSAMPSAARPPLPPVSEAPLLSDAHAGRHARSYSGTQLAQDALADVPMDAMTTLSAGDYAASFKPSLWPLDDVNMEADCMHDETRSLIDMRGRDAPALVDLYRPASSTPTGHRYTAQAAGGSGSARNHSPALMSQSATVASPVAPRSAASTPGRREAVGM